MHKALLLLKKMPKGKVVTYKELARASGTSPRGVGSIMRHNKDMEAYPCYKVVASDGLLRGYSGKGGVDGKKRMLEREGVIFNEQGRVEERSFYNFSKSLKGPAANLHFTQKERDSNVFPFDS